MKNILERLRAFTAIRDALPKPERRYRRCITVGEAKVKIGRRG
jgi:hypothetical protein